MKLKLSYILLLVCLIGCASNQQTLLTGKTLAGTPVCLDDRDNIPAFVKKFFNTRDLTTEEGKIDYLMERIRNSKLIFVRNKVEYDSASAATFLRWKLNRWKKKGAKIDTAQEFVSTIASSSSMSGQPYAVVLLDGSRHDLKSVLQNELDALEYCLKQLPTNQENEIGPLLSAPPEPVKAEEQAVSS